MTKQIRTTTTATKKNILHTHTHTHDHFFSLIYSKQENKTSTATLLCVCTAIIFIEFNSDGYSQHFLETEFSLPDFIHSFIHFFLLTGFHLIFFHCDGCVSVFFQIGTGICTQNTASSIQLFCIKNKNKNKSIPWRTLNRKFQNKSFLD